MLCCSARGEDHQRNDKGILFAPFFRERVNGLGSAIGEGAHGDVSSVDTTVVNEAGPSDAALLLTT